MRFPVPMRSVGMRTRLLQALLVAIAVVTSALSLGACGSSSTSTSSVAALGPLANAADITAKTGGAHMSLSARIEATSLPSAVTMSGGGFFNYKTHQGSLAITLSGLPANAATGSSMTMEEVFDGTDIYVGSPLFAGKLPGGARWMKLDLARFGQAVGISPSALLGGQSNPAQFLEYLKASGGSVQTVGNETVRGVETTHYRGTIDLTKVVSLLGKQGGNSTLRSAYEKSIAKLGFKSLPVDVWADSHHLVRKLEFALSAPAEGQRVGVHMTMELFEFGSTPAVKVPASSEAYDATSSALGGLSSLGG
jgi:hypothetical protein